MMGGYGSTRWQFHSKKDTADDCRVLSIFDLKQKDVLKPDTKQYGNWVWSNAYSGKRTADVGYELNTDTTVPYFRVHYTIQPWHGEKQKCDYHILLQKTACHFGGVRWWFLCPLSRNGRSCFRRVGKLYLPSGGRYFGCRHCYDLTYRSSQESDKRVNALKRLGPRAILEGMNSGNIDLVMGLRALPDEIWRRK